MSLIAADASSAAIAVTKQERTMTDILIIFLIRFDLSAL